MTFLGSLAREVRHTPIFWLLPLVPVALLYHSANPENHTAVFLLSVAAIIPLAATLSRATESVAAKTGDTLGGLLNATLGNLTELVIIDSYVINVLYSRWEVRYATIWKADDSGEPTAAGNGVAAWWPAAG